jgi:hypothetical protein
MTNLDQRKSEVRRYWSAGLRPGTLGNSARFAPRRVFLASLVLISCFYVEHRARCADEPQSAGKPLSYWDALTQIQPLKKPE